MKFKQAKLKKAILAYYRASQELMLISIELGNEDDILDLFSPTRDANFLSDHIPEESKVICIEAWKKRNNFRD